MVNPNAIESSNWMDNLRTLKSTDACPCIISEIAQGFCRKYEKNGYLQMYGDIYGYHRNICILHFSEMLTSVILVFTVFTAFYSIAISIFAVSVILITTPVVAILKLVTSDV